MPVYVHTSDILDKKKVIMKKARRICRTSDGFGIVNFKSFFDFEAPDSKFIFVTFDTFDSIALRLFNPLLLITHYIMSNKNSLN